ncbi:hypothetical protein [Kitasatospora sp. NPDC089509]|uniref:hypothetical protein n=1 Tax=Kitasatospora sp. NPDC089509 TaxID=3364079 RepID=UPI0038229DBC
MTQAELVYAATLNLLGSDPLLPPALEASVTTLRDLAAASHTPPVPARRSPARRLRARLARLPRRLRIGRWEITAGPCDLFIDRHPKPGCTDCQDHRGWYREDGWEFCDCMTAFSSWRLPWRPTPARFYSDEPPF